MADPVDEIEARVDKAFAKAYRDGPEFMELRQAVEAMKVDRRRLLDMTPGDAFNVWADAVSRDADKTAEIVTEEAGKVAKHVKNLAGDIKAAFERFGKGQ